MYYYKLNDHAESWIVDWEVTKNILYNISTNKINIDQRCTKYIIGKTFDGFFSFLVRD